MTTKLLAVAFAALTVLSGVVAVDDAPDFYERQARLLQAQTVLADGEVTTSLDGCAVSYEAVSYDASSGEVTLDVSVSESADARA